MRYENGWIFADGRFVRGGFSVENGRFAHVLEDVPGPAEDLDGALVIPGLVDIHVHGCDIRRILREKRVDRIERGFFSK